MFATQMCFNVLVFVFFRWNWCVIGIYAILLTPSRSDHGLTVVLMLTVTRKVAGAGMTNRN